MEMKYVVPDMAQSFGTLVDAVTVATGLVHLPVLADKQEKN